MAHGKIHLCTWLFAGLILVAASAMAATLVVDDDGLASATDCNALTPADSPTIQGAVSAASAGDTILVCPGLYDEQVTIATANLTIAGAGIGSTIVQPSSVIANTTNLVTGASIAAILLVNGVSGVTIQDVTVDGSVAAFNACTPGYMGIFYRNASGTIDATHVTNLFHPLAPSCQAVLGILIQSGGSGSATVSVMDSFVDHYGKNGITANESGTVVNIMGNTVTGRGPVGAGDAAQNGIQIGFGALATEVSGNSVSDHDYTPNTFFATAILLFAADPASQPNVKRRNNTFSNNERDIFRFASAQARPFN